MFYFEELITGLSRTLLSSNTKLKNFQSLRHYLWSSSQAKEHLICAQNFFQSEATAGKYNSLNTLHTSLHTLVCYMSSICIMNEALSFHQSSQKTCHQKNMCNLCDTVSSPCFLKLNGFFLLWSLSTPFSERQLPSLQSLCLRKLHL